MTERTRPDKPSNPPLESDVSRQIDQLEALTELAKTMVSSLQLDVVLQTIMDRISAMLSPSNWSLLMVDEASGDLMFRIAVGDGADGLKDVRVAMGEGIAGRVALEQTPVVIPDVRSHPDFSGRFDQLTRLETRGIIAVPLVYRGETVGVIEIVTVQDKVVFCEAQLAWLAPFADFAAIAIANAKAFGRVQAMTIQDDCTSLFNARHLHTVVEGEARRADRYGRPVSLVFMDMDRFKSVNDNHGHLLGTRLLAEVAGILLETCRGVDSAARYGGDEFVMVLPETGREGARVFVQRLWRALRERTFLNDAGLELRLTASIGAATLPDDAHDAEALLKAADDAMYLAKNNGRDAAALANIGIVTAQMRPTRNSELRH